MGRLISRVLVLGLSIGATLACGGIMDEDVRQCTWRSDKVCAEHMEKRFEDPALDTVVREQGRVLVHAACDRGEPTACRVYGMEVGFSHPGFAPRVGEGLEALEQACGRNDNEACFQIARLSTQPGPEQNFGRAHEIYTVRCDDDNAGSCNNLAYMIEHGQGVTPDQVVAAGLYDKSCQLGDVLACSNHALMLDLGRGIEMDKSRAQGIWEKLCSPQKPKECFRLANSLRDAGEDLKRPTALTEAACIDGHTPACVSLGYDYSKGRGRDADLKKALSIWLAACEKGEGEACDGAAVAYDHGKGTAEDKARAKALFKQGCDYKYGGACFNLSIHQPDDEARLVATACDFGSARGCNDHGVNEMKKGNQANGRTAYERACRYGSSLACKNLGWNLENKKPIDLEGAYNAYGEGCDMKEAELCRFAGLLLTDQSKAVVWYRKGCVLGDRKSCKKLE